MHEGTINGRREPPNPDDALEVRSAANTDLRDVVKAKAAAKA